MNLIEAITLRFRERLARIRSLLPRPDVAEKPYLTEVPWVYLAVVGAFRIFHRLWGHWCVYGIENVPETGGCIVVANHVSFADPPLVGSALRRPAYFMAKKELFDHPFFKRFLPMIGAYPVKRGVADRSAMKVTLDLIKEGEIVVIFPEGTRREPGERGEPLPGFGWTAYRSRVPVIPGGIVNSYSYLPKGAKWVQHAQVRVHIGKPMEIQDLLDNPDSKYAMIELGKRAMSAIWQLVDEGDRLYKEEKC